MAWKTNSSWVISAKWAKPLCSSNSSNTITVSLTCIIAVFHDVRPKPTNTRKADFNTLLRCIQVCSMHDGYNGRIWRNESLNTTGTGRSCTMYCPYNKKLEFTVHGGLNDGGTWFINDAKIRTECVGGPTICFRTFFKKILHQRYESISKFEWNGIINLARRPYQFRYVNSKLICHIHCESSHPIRSLSGGQFCSFLSLAGFHLNGIKVFCDYSCNQL